MCFTLTRSTRARAAASLSTYPAALGPDSTTINQSVVRLDWGGGRERGIGGQGNLTYLLYMRIL